MAKNAKKVKDEDEVDELDQAIENDTKAPEGVKTAKTSKNEVASSIEVLEDEDEVKSIKSTGKFEAVENLIFNRQGVHVGTEETRELAAKKADRYNSQTR